MDKIGNCKYGLTSLFLITFIGVDFCQNPEFDLNDEQVAGCRSFIEAFIPPAFKSLYEFWKNNGETVCTEVYEVC